MKGNHNNYDADNWCKFIVFYINMKGNHNVMEMIISLLLIVSYINMKGNHNSWSETERRNELYLISI